MHDTGCTGTTQRDGTGREEGGGFRMGNMGLTYYLGMDSGTLRDLSHYIYICMKNSTNEAGILFFIF